MTIEIDAANASCKVGYWLRQDAQGQGLVTRAVLCVAKHAFSELGMNRIGLLAVPHNHRSRAVAERLEFVEEGTLREVEKHGEHVQDLVSYSLLSREFPSDS